MTHEELLLAMMLDDEVAAANSLLRKSIDLLRHMRWLAQDEYVVTVLLAAGMERLLKLTLAFVRVDVEGSSWPTTELKSYGHRIVDLDSACRALIKTRTEAVSTLERVDELARGLDRDLCIGAVLGIAQDFATGGRYFNLDHLGSPGGPRVSPRQRWQRLVDDLKAGLDQDAASTAPEIPDLGVVGVVTSTTGKVSHTLAATVAAWRHFYLTSWECGACGPRAQELGQQIAWPYPDSTSD